MRSALIALALAASLLRPQGPVTDAANVLTPAVRDAAVARIRAVQQKTTAEIALVTVPSLDGQSVEEYGTALFNEWGIGKKEHDNGVLILVAPNERKIRIEVGYGLEPVLPDGLAGEIIRTDALPAFRNGDYSSGVMNVVRRVATVVEANHVVTPAERSQYAAATEQAVAPAWFRLSFLGAFVAVSAALLGASFRMRMWPLVLGGLALSSVTLVMTQIPFFHTSPIVLGAIGFGVFALSFARSRRPAARVAAVRRQPWDSRIHPEPTDPSSSSASWSSSSSDSSSSSSNSSSDSFGGGSSGGGGASGSW